MGQAYREWLGHIHAPRQLTGLYLFTSAVWRGGSFANQINILRVVHGGRISIEQCKTIDSIGSSAN